MRISKKILAIALSILMAVSMMPFTVFAEDVPEGTTYSFTNTSGVTTYKTTAFPSSFSSDGTYKLYQDANLTGRMTLTIFTNNVTIDLNGHNITSTANDSSYPATINLSRKGTESKHRSFSVINTSSTPATITNNVGDGVCIDGDYNDFYLGENVTMVVKGIGVWVDDHTNDTVTIDGDLVSTDYWGLYVNGTNAGPNTLTVNGSVTGDTAGIYAAGVADYIVNGTVTGDTGIYQKGGNLTVNEGAVVTGTGADAAYVENGNGMNSTGDAIVVENNAGYNYGSTTINGGTITSTDAGTSAISTPVASNVASASQEVQDRIDVDVKGGTFTEAGDPADVSAFVNENSDFDPATGVVTHYVAKIGDAKYETFEAAWNAATDGATITLLDDCAGNGLKAPQGKYSTGLTVDFAGYTYTIDGSLVGSTGTQSQAFQLLKDNTITFKNGTIYSEKARMLVQNYSNLTLDGMTLTLNNTTTAPSTVYTLSNNNGTVVIDDTTINANPVNTAFAFDVCRYSSYPSVNVTVTGGSVINGDVEISASKSDPKNGFSLTLENGTMNGDIIVDATAENVLETTPEKAEITKANTFTQAAPEGYDWVDNGDGTSTLERVPADEVSITTADEIDVNLYLDDTGAEKTVTYTFNASPGVQADDQETVTVDFASLPTVGGKKKLAIVVAPAQIRDNIDIDIKNATGDVIRSYDNYSVAAYCDEIAAGDYAANVKTLAKSVLDYGKAASAFFGYNTAAFSNQADNFDGFVFDTTGFTAIASDIDVQKVRYVATSVPSLRFEVDMTEATASTLTATTDKGYAAKFVKVEDKVILQVTGIPASKLGETITVSVKNAQKDVIATIQYTPIIYAYNAAKANNAELARLGETIGQYSAAANAVFA